MMSDKKKDEVIQSSVLLDVQKVLEQLGITKEKLPKDLSTMIQHKKTP